MIRIFFIIFFCAAFSGCRKDEFDGGILNSPFETESAGEFLIVDSLYYPTSFSQPQYVSIKFHDYLRDTSFYHHINVYNSNALFQQLPQSQKNKFEFEYTLNVESIYRFSFTLVDHQGRESRKSRKYIMVVY
jgi:hypothetical protein